MAILINGNGNPAIYAAQDADLIASLAGNTTGIAKVGNEFSYTAEDANTISVADGVIVTKEGRRIQLDAGENDTFTIPAGTAGVTNYYIIGYHLHENASGQQVADTFVQLMASATDTIQEDTFRGGASDVYVSLYRVEQDGVNLGTISALLPVLSNVQEQNIMTYYIENAIAEVYSASSTYKVRDVVTYKGMRYRCTTAINTPEPFNSAHWTSERVESAKANVYRYIGGKQGVGQWVSLPEDTTHQALITVEQGTSNLYYSIVVDLTEIQSGQFAYPFGHYTTPSDYSGGKVLCLKDTNGIHFCLNSLYSNGSDVGSGTYLKVHAC